MSDEELERSGLLVLDKPPGITSHSAVRRVAAALGIKRAGHAGTLDPLATGVLLVGLGRATRLIEYLVGQDKIYRATIRLGELRDTLDREGEVLSRSAVPPLSAADIEEVLCRFVGRLSQVPPLYSAIKVRGRPLHRRVRRGEAVEAPPRTVEIRSLRLLEWSAPDLSVEVECSSGTYVRALARDVGEALGTEATLWDLVRVRSGPFALSDSVSLQTLTEEGEGGWGRVLPPEAMVADLAPLVVEDEAAEALAVGRPLRASDSAGENDMAVFDRFGRLVAIAGQREGEIRPLKVLRPKV